MAPKKAGSGPRLALALLAFAAATGAAGGRETAYRNIFKLDAEYELDRFSSLQPWAWRDGFAAAATGFNVAGGSLNIRHLLIEQRLKTRFPLVDDKLWFRFRHNRRQGLERDDAESEIEFEYSPAHRWYVSLVGDPTFHKSDSLAGFAARWGLEESRSFKVSQLWPAFDANYAFRNTSVNEGYEEFYNRLPQETRFDGVWIQGPVSFRLEGRYRRPSELEHRNFTVAADRYRVNEDFHDGLLDLRVRAGAWTWALEAERWRERDAIAYEPAVPASDRRLVKERSMGRVSVERPLGSRWRARAGGGAAGARGHLRYPGAPASDESYQMYDRPWFLLFFREVSPRFSWDGGWVYTRRWSRSRETAALVEERHSENRGLIAAQYDFNERAGIRAVGTIELDKTQTENFGSFDGGTLVFQAVF